VARDYTGGAPVPLQLAQKIEYVLTTAPSSTFKLRRRLPGDVGIGCPRRSGSRIAGAKIRTSQRKQDQKLVLPRPTLLKLLIRKPLTGHLERALGRLREAARPCNT